MSWDTWELAPDLLGGELSSSLAQLSVLQDDTLCKGPFTISTAADYPAAPWPLTEDMLFSPGQNVAWLQNLNMDFFWCIVRNPAVAVPSSSAVQLSSQTRFRMTVYKMVGKCYRKDSRAWFDTFTPHCEAYDQHNMFSNGFTVHAGKMWSMTAVVFDSTGTMLMMEFHHRGMACHMLKMETWPLHLQQKLEYKLGRR